MLAGGKQSKMVIGTPLILCPDERFPFREIITNLENILSLKIWRKQKILKKFLAKDNETISGEKINSEVSNISLQLGQYELELKVLDENNKICYDSFYFTVMDLDKLPPESSKIAYLDKGKMVYVPDYKGNRIPDFSTVGYMAGDKKIPETEVKIELYPQAKIEDDSFRIQEAIDKVSEMPLDENGMRGAVLLKKGIYKIAKTLIISASGVVLKGEGQGLVKKETPKPPGIQKEIMKNLVKQEGTVLLGLEGFKDIFLKVEGKGGVQEVSASRSRILNKYLPVGANSFYVEDGEKYKVGDKIILNRYGNEDWIDEIGMNRIPPRPNGRESSKWEPFTLDFDREISRIEGNRITIDAPLMNAIENRWGGGDIYKYEDPGRISQVGIENLKAITLWQPNKEGLDDLTHSGQFLKFDNVKNSWVKDISTEHFYGNSVHIERGAKGITVDNVTSLIVGDEYFEGYVSRTGVAIAGQLNLVKDCYNINKRHAYNIHSRVPGPNVIVNSTAEKNLGSSEPHHRWSTGGLFDNVQGSISIQNRLWMGSGHGWAGANYVAWNTRGSLCCQKPPTAQNWAIGHVGDKNSGAFVGRYPEFKIEEGYWEFYGEHVQPASLYFQQLKDRLEKND